MVRKRDLCTRLRAKRGRPKTAAPATGWVIAELSRITSVPVRRLRYYAQRGLIEPSEFRGTATRYQLRELLRVLGITHLRADTRATLGDIKRRLDAMTARELEAWLRTQPLPSAAVSALNLVAPSAGPATQPPSRGANALQVHPVRETSTWQRICLLPGLELMLSTEAIPAVQRAARSICDEYLGGS
jgi:DNA-binding transcriptional MerR regulator